MYEVIKSLFESDLFIAIASAVIGAVASHFLTVHHERKKDKAASNKALQKQLNDLRSRLEVYETTSSSQAGDFLVTKENGEAICPVCWRADQVAIPLYENGDTGHYICSRCGKTGVFNLQKVQRIQAEQEAAQQEFLDSINQLNESRGLYW